MKYTIIGAGIGGLTTALAFEKLNIDYTIFESAPEIKPVGAGIWLAPNALQILEYLNVLEEIQEKGNTMDRITIAKSDLTPILDHAQDAILKRFGYTSVAIHRADFQRIMFDKIPSHKIHLGKSFQYARKKSSHIEIHFEDNTTYKTDYVIGADGIHSKVRKQFFPESEIRYSGQTCWRGIADIAMAPEFQHRAMELWGNQIRFGISKVSTGKVYWFAVALAERNQKEAKNLVKEKLLEMFKDFDETIKAIIKATAIANIIRNDIIDLKPMSRWHTGNICLIGDAAHATTPNMGQGGAQAIEDAYGLSKAIATSEKNAFGNFQKARQNKVTKIVNQSWLTGKIAHWKYGKRFRNMALKSVPDFLIQKQFIKLYEIEP